MLKICDAMCILPSSPYYFISLWIEKKGNNVLIHRKGNKQNIKHYCPVSLLPISGKIFKIYEMFIDFPTNKLISSFQAGDSCMKQILPIT